MGFWPFFIFMGFTGISPSSVDFSNFAFGIMLILFGLLLLLSFERPTITIDKTANRLEVVRASFFEKKKEEFPLEQVTSVRLRFADLREPYFYLDFILEGNEVVSCRDVIKDSNNAKSIADFLNVPFEKVEDLRFIEILKDRQSQLTKQPTDLK